MLRRGHELAGEQHQMRNKEEGKKSRTGFEKRRSGVPVLVFVCWEKSFRRNKCQVQTHTLPIKAGKGDNIPSFSGYKNLLKVRELQLIALQLSSSVVN
ncbi:hypothetical protein J6590_101165 [Homalodisca vitripennis]|nr:hypothetical protein J6590_101165 [Homalodisca vitripennis]